MKAISSTMTHSLLAALALGLVACGTGQQTTGDEIDLALHQDYAGLDESDEAPDFDDADIATAEDLNEGEDVEVVDDTTDASLEEAEQDPAQARRFLISIMWGHLRPRPDIEEPTNWTGYIGIKNGALRVLRTLRFEGRDQLLPRPGVRAVPFISYTQPHHDGLLLEVILHPALVTDPESPPVIVMDTEAYTGALPLVPGMRLTRVIPVDDTGNAVLVNLFRYPTEGCHEGLMVGRYTEAHTTDDGRTVGYMKGKYLSFTGHLVGKIRGVWGERENGAQVFFSKVINRDGEFVGILAGRYSAGFYLGRFLGRDRVIKGVAGGIYREAPEELGGGFFMGRWSVGCGELSAEGEVDPADEANDAVEEEVPSEE